MPNNQKPSLMAAAIAVLPDEPCFQLSEVNLQLPGTVGWHRYQFVYVARGDRLAEYREDMGPREDFTAEEFRIPGGVQDERTGKCEILHTVAELRDIADHLRDGRLRVEVEPPDLWTQFFEEAEEKLKQQAGTSVFGPLHRVERN